VTGKPVIIWRFSLVFVVLVTVLVCCRKATEPDAAAQTELWKQKYESLAATVEQQRTEIEALRKENEDLSQRTLALAEELERCRKRVALATEAERLEKELLQQRKLAEELREKVKELSAEQNASEPQGKIEALEGELRALKDRGRRLAEGLERVGHQAFRAGDYQVALPMLMAAAELGAESPQTLFEIALCLGQAGDLEGAESWYGAAIEKAKEDASANAELLKKAYVNRGAALAQLKKPQEALKYYEKAIELDERYAPVYFNLGLLYQKQLNDAESAIEAFRRHIALGGSRTIAARNAIAALQSAQKLESGSQAPENRPD